MKLKKKYFILPIVIFLLLILNSCDNTLQTPSLITVSGQVGYDFGLAENYKVEIDGQTAVTDLNGRFTIGNVLTPYTVKILNPSGTFAHVYQGVSITNPYFNWGPAYPISSTIAANINVELPVLPSSNQTVSVIFIPDSYEPPAHIQATTINNNEILTKIRWNEQIQINGKMVVMYYTKSGGKIVSYDRLYHKQVTLYDDVPAIYSIPPSDPYFNPDEAVVTGTVSQTFNAPSNFDIDLVFPGSKEDNILEFAQDVNSFDFVVPQGLPMDYKIRVRAIAGYGNEEWAHGIKNVFPGSTGNIIDMYDAPSVTLPAANDTISLYNSLTQWTPGQGTGVYQVGFLINEGGNLNVVYLHTSALSANVPDLSEMGFTYSSGTSCRVYVRKLFGFNTVNAMVDGNMIDDPDYSGSSFGTPVNVRVY
jgi:hypothetical protein